MALSSRAPYAAQDTREVTELISALESHQKSTKTKGTFSCKKNTFAVPNSGGLTVDSWRFQEWDYKREDLPTYARGLFTHRSKDAHPEIVTRGYDKFFNVDEVYKTRWQTIKNNTRGPYTLSVKENGCIIFISGLSDDSLLVCSKHSTGARQDTDVSHAVAGERWIDRHLESVGKTRSDLAKDLRRKNATAVAELCDDDFEEHILAYDERKAGLYLHGINLNLPEFATYPCDLVHEFADQWGLKKAEFLVKDGLESVQTFLTDVAETGSWHGRDVEGFVIRCKARDSASGPYSDWFFKFKFEEPYLMFRQWREVTKAVISGKLPRYKKHKQITEEYLRYARKQLAANPKLAKEFNQNHGIIAMREGFLQEKGVRGSDVIRQEMARDDTQVEGVVKDVVLVPVATIGCGKTTVAVALTKLFGWGHVQNDNIEGRKNRTARFASEVCSSLAASNVTIADRNNHQRRERRQILDDVRRAIPEAHFVALHYVHEKDNVPRQMYHDELRKAMWDRVLTRGDNHQTIHAGSKSQQEIVGIMEGFLHRFEPVDTAFEPDDGFDLVIDLNPTVTSRENLETVVSQLHFHYPKLLKEPPGAKELDEAMDAALQDYGPDLQHDLSFTQGNSKKALKAQQKRGKLSRLQHLEFFCVRLDAQEVLSQLDILFSKQDPETANFYRQLQQNHRVQTAFHVTLIHRASSTTHAEAWQHFSSLYDEADRKARTHYVSGEAQPDPELGFGRVQLERVVWDDRVMCIVSRLLDAKKSGFDTTNEVAHVTVGTARQGIKPKESNDLLSAWLGKGSGGETGIDELQFENKTVLWGTVKAVYQ